MILEAVRDRDSVPFSQDLRTILSTAARNGGSLFLAEDEPALLRFLDQNLDDSVSIIPISRADWRQQVEGLVDELQKQIESPTSLTLVVVGSSGDGAVKAASPGKARGFEKWVDAARQCQQQFEDSKRHFAERVRELPGWTGGKSSKPLEVQLQALFFHAPAGVFLSYDWEQDAFFPLSSV